MCVCVCVCVKTAVSVDLIISAACSGVRSSTATLLIFTSWSPGTSRPSAGPPGHTKCPCVVKPEGVQLICIHAAAAVDNRQQLVIFMIFFHLKRIIIFRTALQNPAGVSKNCRSLPPSSMAAVTSTNDIIQDSLQFNRDVIRSYSRGLRLEVNISP